MKVIVTGAAGFIGFHLAGLLSRRGHAVVGVDNLNDYYMVGLKHARLERLPQDVVLHRMDVADHESLHRLFQAERPDVVVHMAAQAGVRYSLDNPFAYASSNLTGHLSVLEACRHCDSLSHLIYASSSSVYGEDSTSPFNEDAPCNHPVSLYAATKRADELMSDSYAHLYGITQAGLRFFTVYGRYGRPDMAYWMFTEKILKGEPIRLFNHGRMERDMTHVSDVVDGITSVVERKPFFRSGERPHRIYNIGNNRPEQLGRMVDVIEKAAGRPAIRNMAGMQPGDVTSTCADISRLSDEYGYTPTTPISSGLPDFVAWFRDYHGV